jgi:hypothetical protein
MYKEKIVDVTTGQITFRDYTEEEIIEVEKAKEESEIENDALLAKQAAKREVFAKLGLTEDDFQTLGL